MRVITQLSTAEGGVCALCDDGTSWTLAFGGDWKQLPPIPQPEREPKPFMIADDAPADTEGGSHD